MTDKTEITGTPAQRFGLVMSWLPAPIIFLSTLLASVALVAFIYDGPDDDYLFLSLVALFGGMISLALAAAGYIVSGEFRFLPPVHARKIKQALLFSPIVIPVLLIMFVEVMQAAYEEKAESGKFDVTTAEPSTVKEAWYEKEQLAPTTFAVKNKVTNAHIVLKDTAIYEKGHPDFIAATVLYRQLIASAYWEMDCEPNKTIADKFVCSQSGESAHASFRVEEPQWDSGNTGNNITWKFNSSGFLVEENFYEWPLNEARQKDAFQLSHDIDRPSPQEVTHVMHYLRKGRELWDGPKRNYFDKYDEPTIRFLDENKPGS